MGSFGKGSLQKNFPQISAEISAEFSARFPGAIKTHFFANFREFSAKCPQTFRKNPFANDPISELLIVLQPQNFQNGKNTLTLVRLQPKN